MTWWRRASPRPEWVHMEPEPHSGARKWQKRSSICASHTVHWGSDTCITVHLGGWQPAAKELGGKLFSGEEMNCQEQVRGTRRGGWHWWFPTICAGGAQDATMNGCIGDLL